ncbi:MAG: O-antigen ligase family protein [Gemmataceae bacterium]|nr:O-antigen ligase family protein [Gemmataceae bacterium]
MAFALFILVNAVLFTRPAEVVDSLQALPIYYVVMSACLVISLPAMLDALVRRNVYAHPAFICMAGFCVVALTSLFVNAKSLSEASDEGIELIKTFLYLVLFLALVDRPWRLRATIVFLTLFGMITASIALLHFFEIVRFSTIRVVKELLETPNGEMLVERLQFTGILQDPNEACVYLSMLCIYALHGLTDRASGIWRTLWIAPLALFLFAIAQTQSRGGLLALLVGLVVYWIYAFGGRKGLMVCLLGVPVVLVVFAGRQTQFSGATTGQTRIGLWSDWMDEFRNNPILGIGPKIKSAGEAVGAPAASMDDDEKPQRAELKHLAHNSYLQSFSDTGLMGGILFLGAFTFAFFSMNRYASFQRVWILDPDSKRMHACIMGATAVYGMGMLTLTLNYIVVTFFALAVPIAFVNMIRTAPRIEDERLTLETGARTFAIAIAFLAFTYILVRLFRNY